MTDQRLRDLLEERVADVTVPDLTAGAWAAGRRARRRDRWVAGGAAAVLVAAVGAGTAVLGDADPTGPEPAPALPQPSSTGGTGAGADATYEGVPVSWSPDEEEEQELPRLDSDVLPGVIDLDSGPMVKAMDHAVAAFAIGDTVRLVDADGGQVGVNIARLDDVTKPNGYAYRPVSEHMLSPDGKHLVFPQDGGYVAVYSLDGGWNTFYAGQAVTRFVRWVGPDTLVLPQTPHGAGVPFDVEGDPVEPADVRVSAPFLRPSFATEDAQEYGPTRLSTGGSQAQTWGMGVPIPVEDAGDHLSDPEFVAVRAGGAERVLALMWRIPRDGQDGRYLQCCPVAGWLDDRTLVYESRQTSPLLVGWDAASGEFSLVTRIRGSYDLASFADLG